ncbi:MAG: P1 family peptidase, partial [Bauldia sp.]
DLLNGGDKTWGEEPPYRRLGHSALEAAGATFALGSAGAGAGATTASLKGGLGSASVRLDDGITVAALAAVNAVGQATIGDSPHFWAAAFEVGREFGGLGLPRTFPAGATKLVHKAPPRAGQSTTIAVVATDAPLTKAEAKRLAVMAHDGFARALWPAHTPFDGDIVFALATGQARADRPVDMVEIGSAGAACAARAIARGVYEATPAADDRLPTWRQLVAGRLPIR